MCIRVHTCDDECIGVHVKWCVCVWYMQTCSCCTISIQMEEIHIDKILTNIDILLAISAPHLFSILNFVQSVMKTLY